MAAGRSARNPSGIAFGGGGLWGVALGYSWERGVEDPAGIWGDWAHRTPTLTAAIEPEPVAL